MRLAARMELKSGMILGEDVIHQGNVVFKADTVLDDHIIERLKRYSIMAVTIKEPIDLATTKYEKLRLSQGFKAFEQQYNKELFFFKKKMISFISNGEKLAEEDLLKIYYDLSKYLPNSNSLLDYLYCMLPNEDELTFNQLLSSALLAGTMADWLSMNEESRKTMILCGFYYDIGKALLPYQILWKPEKLTNEEFEIVRQHPVKGYDLIKNLNIRQEVKNCVLMHHEKIDGSGYPYHLEGNILDKYTKYITIVDAYIAMASPRSYRAALSPLQIIEIFEKDLHKFDPELMIPIIKHIAEAQIGNNVTLSDGTKWEVFLLNPIKYSRPMLRNDKNEIINLLEHPELDYA